MLKLRMSSNCRDRFIVTLFAPRFQTSRKQPARIALAVARSIDNSGCESVETSRFRRAKKFTGGIESLAHGSSRLRIK